MESPFEPPSVDAPAAPAVKEIGPGSAALGLLVCLYSIGVIFFVARELIFVERLEGESIFYAVALIASVGGVIGGWRLGGRRPAGWWIWLWLVPHLLAAAGIAAVLVR
ncbi:MAG: hypothetical protein RIT81_16725 [Deltaproteobacteria bacterium]